MTSDHSSPGGAATLHEPGALSAALVRSAVHNSAAVLVVAALELVMTPFYLHYLGAVQYGVLLVTVVSGGYMLFLEFGLSESAIKHLAEFHAREQREGLEALIGVALTTYGVIGVCVAAAMVAASRPLVGLFDIPLDMQPVAVFALRVGSLGFLVTMTMRVFDALPKALQRFDISNGILVGMAVVQAGVNAALMASGRGLREIVIANLLVALAGTAANLLVCRCLVPGIRFRPRWQGATAKRLVSFGTTAAAGTLASNLALQVLQVVIALTTPVANVAYFRTGYRLASLPSLASRMVGPVVMPAASRLDRLGQRLALQELHLRATRAILLGGLPLAVAVIVFARPLLSLWVGQDVAAHAALTARLLAVGAMMSCLGNSFISLAHGAGRPQIVARANLGLGATVIVLCLPLVRLWGMPGAGAAWSLAHLAWVPMYFRPVLRAITKGSGRRLLHEAVLRPVALGAGLAGLEMGVLLLAGDSCRWLLLAGVPGLLYLAGGCIFALDSRDRQALLAHLSRLGVSAARREGG